jgi:PhnB protein
MTDKPDQGPRTGVTPHLTVPDGRCREAVAFYERAFAAEQAMPPMPAGEMPKDGRAPDMKGDQRIMHAHLRINGGSLMLNDAFPEFVAEGDRDTGKPAWTTLHLQVDDADTWFDRAIAAGGTATMPPADMFWGDRYGQLRDPFGFTWSIGGPVKGDGE